MLNVFNINFNSIYFAVPLFIGLYGTFVSHVLRVQKLATCYNPSQLRHNVYKIWTNMSTIIIKFHSIGI